MIKQLIFIFIAAVITNNFVLAYFLGICPFIGVSNKFENAIGLGIATTFVMTLAATVTWLAYHYILVPYNLPFLEYVIFILIIASLVQFVEMFIRKTAPALYKALGIFLPLITTNCAVLGLTLFMVLRNYSFLESMVFGFSSGLGFTLALVIMAGIREELAFSDIPEPFK
ncbi:MAG: RnfABCDGE type electron transport complex subunit A, partial [Candidatus Omnitrophica bacterium]|nr:RnfABCDGE type electron transport complex subunit A [Candidatus Omnitrophota bacterium]